MSFEWRFKWHNVANGSNMGRETIPGHWPTIEKALEPNTVRVWGTSNSPSAAERRWHHLDFERSISQTVYGICAQICRNLYGSEIWPMKKGHTSMLERTEMWRSRKIGLEVVEDDMKGLGLASADALNLHAWVGRLEGTCADPGLPGAPWNSSKDEWAIEWCVCVSGWTNIS